MAQSDPNGDAAAVMRHLYASQEALNRQRSKMLAFRAFYGEPPPPTRVQKIKRRAWWVVRDTRERIALRIAPWLDEY